MVSIENVRKYLNDHPEIDADRKEAILTAAEAAQDENRISGGAATNLMGDLAESFFGEVTTNMEHIRIALKDLQRPA